MVKQIQYKKQSINYIRKGKGEPLVLLHGFLESHTMWLPLLPQLVEDFDIIAIDLPGHGKSGDIAETHTMALMAKVVHAVLEKEGISKAHFMGHSMGGYVVLEYVALFSEYVDRIILLNSTPLDDTITRKENRERAIVLIQKYPEAFISMGVTNLFSKTNAELFEDEIENTKKNALTFSLQGIIANIKGMKIRDTHLKTLQHFKGNKAIIAGIEDPIIEMKTLEDIVKQTQTTLYKVNGGHMSHFEAQQDVINITRRFLKHSNLEQ